MSKTKTKTNSRNQVHKDWAVSGNPSIRCGSNSGTRSWMKMPSSKEDRDVTCKHCRRMIENQEQPGDFEAENEQNHKTRITDQEKAKIRKVWENRSEGMTLRDVAKRFGRSRRSIHRIVSK